MSTWLKIQDLQNHYRMGDLIAGRYPAARAAKLNLMQALRHD